MDITYFDYHNQETTTRDLDFTRWIFTVRGPIAAEFSQVRTLLEEYPGLTGAVPTIIIPIADLQPDVRAQLPEPVPPPPHEPYRAFITLTVTHTVVYELTHLRATDLDDAKATAAQWDANYVQQVGCILIDDIQTAQINDIKVMSETDYRQ